MHTCLGYYKQCCCEHRGTCIFLTYSFVWMFGQEWDCSVIGKLYVQFFEEPAYCFPQGLYQFTFPPTVQTGSFENFLSLLMKVQYCGFPQVGVLLIFVQLPCIVHAHLTAHEHIPWITAALPTQSLASTTFCVLTWYRIPLTWWTTLVPTVFGL